MKQYYIKSFGELVPVSKEIHTAIYKAWRRERYLVERDKEHGTFSYNALDSDGFQGESIIIDKSMNTEDSAIKVIMLEKLCACLKTLSQEDKQLILALHSGITEHQAAFDLGVTRSAIHYRKHSIMAKLRNMLKI